ncbi:MAG: hypothetical protein ACI9U2_004116 [Bradymonadia bacterium]|jgi:hypothetical protein
MFSALALPLCAMQIALSGPVLGALVLRSAGDLPVDETTQVLDAARPGFAGCLEAAHALAPLEETGSLTLVLQIEGGAVVRAATILRPARADLARCLRERVKPLTFAILPERHRVRVTADWSAPPPPNQADYPYAVKRRAPAAPLKKTP